jgi:hypothetical protein
MRRRPPLPLLIALALLAAAACAPPARPLTLSAAPADKARLVVYCDNNPVNDPSWTTLSLDGAPLGAIGPGNVFYRDVVPGTHEIAVRSEQLYPGQAKALSLGAGTTTYVNVQVVIGWGKSETKPTRPFALALVEPAAAEPAIAPLALSR